VTALLATPPATAQNATYACQSIVEGGLTWENGQWKTSKFILSRPFLLDWVNSEFTGESVAKALGASFIAIFCHERVGDVQSCGSSLGGTLLFDFANLTGATSRIFGAALKNNRPIKDNLVIRTFTCTKM
jgi:hypothetical protein